MEISLTAKLLPRISTQLRQYLCKALALLKVFFRKHSTHSLIIFRKLFFASGFGLDAFFYDLFNIRKFVAFSV